MKKILAVITSLVILFTSMITNIELSMAEETVPTVESVVQMLEEIDSLQAMQDARVSHSEPDTWYAYVAEMFNAHAAAKAAYDQLSEADKLLVPAELLKKLEPIDTVFNKVESTIVEGTDGYQFQAVFPKGNYAYEIGTHFNDGGHPMTVVVVDTAKISGKWAPADKYSFGVSDYEVLYCCEIQQPVVNGTHYKRVNLEDADYYDDDDAAHIRAIITNSYPYVSLEQMKLNLKNEGFEYADELTRGDVVSAVQFAIWTFSNRNYAAVEGMGKYGSSINIDRLSYAKQFHDYTNELWDWWPDARNGSWVDENARARVDALVDYLVGLEKSYADKNTIVISSIEVVDAEPVKLKEGVFSVAVKVKLNNGGISDEDSVKLTVTSLDENKNVTGQVVTEVSKGIFEYNLMLEARNGETIHVAVDGVQVLPQGVYLYEPEGGKEVSQVLVGIADGKTKIKAEDEITLDIPEDPDTYDIKLKKTDARSNPLAGAEFSLNLVTDKTKLFVEKVFVDESGELVFEDILPGKYEISETVTPDGFVSLSGNIVFSISDDGEITVLDMPEDVSFNNDEFCFTVINRIPPKDFDITGTKLLDGDVAKDFEFKLSTIENGEVTSTQTALSGLDGLFNFKVQFAKEGTYTFTVEEEKGTDETIVYDECVYTLTITVTEVDGEFVVDASILKDGAEADGDIVFENYTKTEIPPEEPPLGSTAETVWTIFLVIAMLGIIMTSMKKRAIQ